MRPRLQVLAATTDVASNLIVLPCKCCQLVSEFARSAPPLDFDLSSERLEFVDVPGTRLVFDGKQAQIELLLVRLREELHQELACLEDLGAKDGV